MNIDIKKLNQLITVAKTGNFSRAAEELNISQPALSRSIAQFEEHFGIKIFDRGRSGASLTQVGALAIAEAESLLKKARTLNHNLHLYGQGDAGEIVVGMGPLIASMVLPKLSIYFLKNRPKLHIQAATKSVITLLNELLNDQIEVLYCTTKLVSPNEELSITPIGKIYLSMIVRTSHPLASQKIVTTADVARFPRLSGADVSSQTYTEGLFVCDNYHILRESVMHTDSVWVSSPQFVIDELKSGLLTEIVVVDSTRPHYTNICEVRRAGCTPSPAANAISAFVRDYFINLSP